MSKRSATATAAPAAPKVDRRIKSLVTPEGVDLRLQLGSAGERAAAFLVDAAIIIAALIGMSILAAVGGLTAGNKSGAEIAFIIWIACAFLLRNFYFIGFELRAGAATPGKRLLGLRVAARDGGRLTAGAIFARNAMREIEVFLPMSFLFARGSDVDGWLILLGTIWTGVFVLFPLFNRDRLRLGDMAAGTIVLRAPKQRLAADLSEDGAERMGSFDFSPAQLQAYGVKELHVLEEVLRGRDRRAMREVARTIRKKIAYPDDIEASDESFLSAYYAALRGRLENRLLFGHRRKDKFDTA